MSNLYKCSNCGHAIASTARFCTGCRTPGPIARHPNSWRTSEPPEAISELLAAGHSQNGQDGSARPPHSASPHKKRRIPRWGYWVAGAFAGPILLGFIIQGVASFFALTWLLCSIGLGLTFYAPTRRAISWAVLAPLHVPLHRARWLLAVGAVGSFVFVGVVSNPRGPAATAVSSAARTAQENWCSTMAELAMDSEDQTGDMSRFGPVTRAYKEEEKRVYGSTNDPSVRTSMPGGEILNVYYDECMKNSVPNTAPAGTPEFEHNQIANLEKLGWVNLKEQAAIALPIPAEVLTRSHSLYAPLQVGEEIHLFTPEERLNARVGDAFNNAVCMVNSTAQVLITGKGEEFYHLKGIGMNDAAFKDVVCVPSLGDTCLSGCFSKPLAVV